MAMNQMNHLNTIANMAAAAQIHSPLSRAGTSVIKIDMEVKEVKAEEMNGGLPQQ
ncbi:Dachshund 2 [Saguinus oedipus]|uniref:Dachshund 2 n=1 Tax=Saguinus oedipus TaxID=9490 RepID=A0ABQ9TFJ6_SAGOE|nr:Dachshund 2 [Saguinus oedipus]